MGWVQVCVPDSAIVTNDYSSVKNFEILDKSKRIEIYQDPFTNSRIYAQKTEDTKLKFKQFHWNYTPKWKVVKNLLVKKFE